MTVTIRPPIVVDEHGDLCIFETVEAAERYLEPIDVRNEEFICYDSEARLLLCDVDESYWVERVVIRPVEPQQKCEEELMGKLRSFLYSFIKIGRLVESERWVSRAPLPALIDMAIPFNTV